MYGTCQDQDCQKVEKLYRWNVTPTGGTYLLVCYLCLRKRARGVAQKWFERPDARPKLLRLR